MNRRRFVALSGAGLGFSLLAPFSFAASRDPGLLKSIPSSGESIPPVGMGTWVTFNIGDDPVELEQRLAVLREFFDHGGGMIDSSPMYGSAEWVLGRLLPEIDGIEKDLFTATKVWTSNGDNGRRCARWSRRLLG